MSARPAASMSSNRTPRSPRRSRKLRSRPTPRWLKDPSSPLEEMARRRCLMVLAVLSGEQPVSEAIAQAQISRGTYYKLESQALKAMLGALQPGAEASSAGEGPAQRIAQLETKVKRLEQDKRRSDRLLFLTRQVVKPGPMKSAPGRPAKGQQPRSSKPAGKRPSPASKTKSASEPTSPTPSSPTPAGAAAPWPGTES